MPLRRKLLFAMMIPAILLVTVGAIGVYSLRHLEQAAGRILADNYRSIQETRRMEEALRAFLSADPDHPASMGAGSPERVIRRFESALDGCEANITEAGETAVLRSIRSRWVELKPTLTADGGPSAEAGRDRAASVAEIYGDVERLVVLNETAMIEYEQETRHVAKVMLGAVTGSSLAAIIALTLFALISARRISRPVVEVADRLHLALGPDEGAGGSATRSNVDEIGRLRQELDALLERLRRHEDEQNRKLSHLQGRLAFVMNEVLEGMVLLDAEQRVMTMNRVARALLGPGIAEGSRLGDGRLRPDVQEALAPFLAGDFQPERDLDELHHAADGEERIYRPRVLTVTAGGGTIEGYLLLFWDVTEQQRFEESRRRFISMLSHQLKTPMTSLSMSVNLMREKIRDAAPAQAELLAIATEDCNNLAALISDLIDAAKDVTPELTLKIRRVDVARLLRSSLRPLVPQAEEKEIDLVLPAADGGVFAEVDPVKFPWVVTNIVGNALRYTPPRGRVSVEVTPGPDGIRVSVTDTGAGIPAEHLDKIFQPYWSLDEEPRPGTHGLGLAIAREVMEAHGGSIAAESRPGAGTSFHLHLPSHGAA
ncbi:PAS domain-containing protein [bacterium]|nr:PAS domain-containing protein [bacterium]